MLRALLAALVVAGLVVSAGAAPALAATRVPRVTIIVGPVGATTDYYRSLADGAAKAARGLGAEVVTVYSPVATWPAVQAATEGASIVVYLGHGNGWPSPYRNKLSQATNDGFGLNPVAGVDDVAHQYFGERYVASLHLARNAVVVFSHLCYASGNSEPGLPEGTREDAIQRVDNYAAGFLRAGAKAVIAETAQSPAYYVTALLKGKGTVESIWSKAPTHNGHTMSVASRRTPGYTVRLDPETSDGGYVRSIVSKGVTAPQLRAGASGLVYEGYLPLAPTLANAGVKFGDPQFRDLPVSGTTTQVTLPVAGKRGSRIPAGTQVSVRWDPILLDPSGTAGDGASVAPPVSPAPSTAPAPSASPSPSASPDTATAASLIVPEQLGAVIEPAKAIRSTGGLRLGVQYPAAPGLYRFSTMLHTPGGLAYDAATQSLLPTMLVRVGGQVAGAYRAPATLTLVAQTANTLAVQVMNTGAVRWDKEVPAPPSKLAGEEFQPDRMSTLPAQLVATWVSADGRAVPGPVTVNLDAAAAAPGGSAEAVLELVAPFTPGEYLLVLDVLSSSSGALSAVGTSPAIVRVTVAEPPAKVQVPIEVPARRH